ncbi:MAG: hypothetical protein ACKVLC_08745 [Phycisphaerales bacterium]
MDRTTISFLKIAASWGNKKAPGLFSLQIGTFEDAISSVQWHPVAIDVNNTRNQGEHLISPI